LPNKAQIYAELADRQTRNITGSRENWTGFLNTAGRLYKYPFEEQLMIYAQRPNAQACASFDLWNENMNRYIRRGSKGIALLDMTSGKPRLKYVFDYADTADGRRNPRRPFIWELNPEHEKPVTETLATNYDLPDSNKSVGDMIYDLAQELSTNYYNMYDTDIQNSFEGSYLEDYEEYDRETTFIDAMTVSTAYAIMTRCGIDPAAYIGDEAFLPIFDFTSPTSVYALGTAVSTVTEEILRDIEVTIKKYEREKIAERSAVNERTDIQPTRGLSVSEYSVERSNDGITRQIRNDENELSETIPSDIIHDVDVTGENLSALSGNRTNSDRTIESDNDGIINTNIAARQSNRPDSVDGSHEQFEIASGRNNPDGTDLHLDQNENIDTEETPSEEETGGVILFPVIPTEQEQIESIQKSEETDLTLQPVVITQDDIDNAILLWNGDHDSKARVFNFMLENGRARNTAEFLKNE
jgi:hypothetical protein